MTDSSSLDSPTQSVPSARRRNWAITVAVPVAVLAVTTLILAVVWWTSSRRLAPDDLGKARGVLDGWNVLLVSFDTLRADHLRCYGHAAIETPVIDGLAAEGVRFAHAISSVPLTLPSHSTMMTGLYPPRHGVRNNGTFCLEEAVTTLAEILQAKGYRTGAVVSAFVLDRRFGLAQGFDHYDDDLTEGDQPARGGFRERRAELTNRAAITWLRDQAEEPFFLFVHYFDAHWPYIPPSPYRERYERSAYDGEIAYADDQLGKLLAAVDQKGVRQRTLVIVTADHGESLGEHGEMSHGIFIYDGTQHVPLIVSGPSPLPRGHTVEYEVGVVDITPTVLNLLGIDPPGELDGRNLFTAQAAPREVYMECLGVKLMHGCAPLFGVRRNDFKFIFAPTPELYDLQGDPRETANLHEQRPAVAEELYAGLKGFVGDDVAAAGVVHENLVMSEEVAEKLRGLGYVVTVRGAATDTAPSARAEPEVLPDAKDMIVHLRRGQLGQQFIMQGQFEKGFRVLEKHAKLCPTDVISLMRLAEGYLAVGRLEDSLRAYRKVIAENPDQLVARAGAGSILLRLKRTDEAEQMFQDILRRDPQSTAALLGMGGIHLAREDYDAALAAFRRVAEQAGGSKNGAGYSNMAIVYAKLGKLDAAREALKKALRIDPGNVHAAMQLAQLDKGNQGAGTAPESIEKLRESLRRHADPDGQLTLGLLLHDARRLDEAEAALQKAAEQRPDHVETLWALGRVLVERRRLPEAERLLRRCAELDAKHTPARSQLAIVLAQQGRLEEGARWLAEALKLAPDQANLHYNLGVIREKQNRLEEAAALVSRAVELDPNVPRAHFHLGRIQANRNRPRQAAEHFRKALRLDPNYAEAKDALDRLGAAGG